MSRPLLLVGLAIAGLAILYQSRGYSSISEWQQATERYGELLRHPELICDTSSGECLDDAFREDPDLRKGYEYQLTYARKAVQTGRTALSPAGGAVVVVGLMSSAVGVFMALFAASAAVGVELRGDGLRAALTRNPRRVRFLITKMAVASTLLVGFMAVGIGLLGVMNHIFGTPIGAESGAPWNELQLPAAAIQIGMPLLVVMTFVALATAFGFAFRSSLAAVVGPVLVTVVDGFVGRSFPWATSYTLSFNIWSLGRGFRSEAANLTTTVWIWASGFPSKEVAAGRAILAVVTGLLLFSVLAIAVLRRQDVH